MRQAALDAWGSIKTPELSALQVQLQKEVQQGTITPEQAEASLLGSNAFDAIRNDPSLGAAQHAALEGLQATANAGGLTAVDKARLQDVTDNQNQVAKGRLDAIQSNAKERGVGGSGLEMASALENEQEAANRASRQGTDVAGQAQQAALEALQASGQQAGAIRAQDYGEAANKAESQNAIDKFNAQTLNATNLYNTQTANEAQAANLAEKQRVADANTATANNQALYNSQQNQTVFNDNAAKAAGESGVYNNWANDATSAKNKEIAGNQALVGGIVNGVTKAGAAAFGGPATAAATPDIIPNTSSGSDSDPNAQKDPFGNTFYQNKGGVIPGTPKVPGDSIKNDTVDVKASPGELVVPRSAMSDEDEFDKFMEQFKPKAKNSLEKQPPHIQALADLHARVRKIEGGH